MSETAVATEEEPEEDPYEVYRLQYLRNMNSIALVLARSGRIAGRR